MVLCPNWRSHVHTPSHIHNGMPVPIEQCVSVCGNLYHNNNIIIQAVMGVGMY